MAAEYRRHCGDRNGVPSMQHIRKQALRKGRLCLHEQHQPGTGGGEDYQASQISAWQLAENHLTGAMPLQTIAEKTRNNNINS